MACWLVVSAPALAHLEPARALWERAQQQRARERTAKARLKTCVTWSYPVTAGKVGEARTKATPSQTAGMRSGRVVLAAGTSMHRHSTKQNEEVLVMLSGTVRVVLGDAPMELAAGQVLYIPPNTEHEVHNDGSVEARYLYLVAPAR